MRRVGEGSKAPCGARSRGAGKRWSSGSRHITHISSATTASCWGKAQEGGGRGRQEGGTTEPHPGHSLDYTRACANTPILFRPILTSCWLTLAHEGAASRPSRHCAHTSSHDRTYRFVPIHDFLLECLKFSDMQPCAMEFLALSPATIMCPAAPHEGTASLRIG
ncbi:hypothetical protein E2C01_015490 [Portunus trituberculatus]|uniref:Uncharacterized protein n=1 Tax=Portunus trituberculatus TaxID=210409 RepID=A0A5B7DMQ5_PORTR|nr:hypothetical protein [Portunus trituberculatus]